MPPSPMCSEARGAHASAHKSCTRPGAFAARFQAASARPRGSRSTFEAVRQAAQLHDIGKVAIPEAILHKPGTLDDDEWAFMRRHSEIGERIIAEAPALTRVAAMVRASHERFDGGGYPDGLSRDEIPLGARIVAVCDAFDAMITERAYSAAMSPEDAERELRACAGSQFDPDVVEAFCSSRSTTAHLRAVA
jgi:two-component system, cell cycle response regulator